MTFGLRYTRGALRLDSALFTGLTSLDSKIGVTTGVTWVFESPLAP